MKLKPLLIALVVVVGAAGGASVAVTQEEPPGDPASFYGGVSDASGNNAPAGTTIYAVAIDSNGDTSVEASITVEVAGEYGGEGATAEKLRVDSNAGQEVRFHVNDPDGPQAGSTVQLEAGVHEVDLTFPDGTFAEVAGDGGDTSPAGPSGSSDEDDGTEEVIEEPASKAVALAGTNPTVRIDEGKSVSMVGFGSQTDLDDTVTVTEVTTSPSPEPQGRIFVSGAEISFGDGGGENVETVQMGIQQSRLDELGVSADKLALYHLNEDGEWEALETEVAYEDNFEVVLEAPSAGFSTYAVFAQEDVTTTMTTQEPTSEQPSTVEEPTTTEQPPTTTETPDEGGPGSLLIGGILVVVLAILAALYLAFGRE